MLLAHSLGKGSVGKVYSEMAERFGVEASESAFKHFFKVSSSSAADISRDTTAQDSRVRI